MVYGSEGTLVGIVAVIGIVVALLIACGFGSGPHSGSGNSDVPEYD